MTALRLTRRAGRLARGVGRQGRELGVLPGFPVPERHVRLPGWPGTAESGGATVTRLGEIAPQPLARARTVHPVRSPDFDARQAEGIPGRPLLVVTAPGASLATDGGAVITAEGELVYDTLWDDPHYERSEFSSRRRLAPPTVLDGTCASLISLWHSNYHHWLFEALPRLAVLERAGLSHLPLIVPERPAPFHRDTLAALGHPPARWRPFAHEHVRPDVLVWASPASTVGVPSRYAVDWLRKGFLRGRAPAPTPRRRIYLSRRLAYARRVANEQEVAETLARHGFETVDAERLTFGQQVELFAAAEAVVAPHGAGLSNIVFGNRLAVLEIFQPRYLHLCYYALAGACDHAYWYLLAEPSDDRQKDADLIVPIPELIASVEQMLASLPG